MNWLKKFWKALSTPVPQARPPVATASSLPPEALPKPEFTARLTTPVRGHEPMYNFTPRAQQVLALARREADRFNHHFVGTEHLLLGLIALGQGVAVNVLQEMGLSLEVVRAEVEKQVGCGPEQTIIGNIPYTPRVKKVLALAAKEAKALNHTYVGTEHILLGLLREGDGVAGRVLKNLKVEVEQTRMEILQELDPNFAVDDRMESPPPTEAKPEVEKASPASAAPGPRKPPEVDVTSRYDVYCVERSEEDLVVHRNVLFKGVRTLFLDQHGDRLCDYYELEQPDGVAVFVARYSVIKFHKAGAKPES